MIILGIDPGVKCCGWAVYQDGSLVRVGLARGAWWLPTVADIPQGPAFNIVAIECPYVYHGAKARPNDIVALGRVVGACAQKFRAHTDDLILVRPMTWKGSAKKERSHIGILAKLSQAEASEIPTKPKGLVHNAIDAVGIAQWAVEYVTATRPERGALESRIL